MKKSLLIIAVLGLTFASCKKDRVCSCKTVTSYTKKAGSIINPPADDVQDDKYTMVDVSGSTARKACVHTKYEYDNSFYTVNVDQNCSIE